MPVKSFVDENGNLHREDGPALIQADGSLQWWLNGEPHREDGPAVDQKDGTKAWYIHGINHREDGPAVVWASGEVEWWYKGDKLDFDEWARKVHLNEKNKLLMALKCF